MENTLDVKYDNHGRMQYHPALHTNQFKPWTTSDERYLIENYAFVGAGDMSLALGRTVTTVATRAWKLRRKGLMTPTLRGQANKNSNKVTGGEKC